MGNNFLHIEVGKDLSNRWRNIVVVGVLVVGSAGGWMWSRALSSESPPLSDDVPPSFVETEDSVVFETMQSGGDLVSPPPADAAPDLPLLDGTLLSAADISAVSAVVKDTESGVMLYAKNEYAPRPIASITKLMSALVILEAGPDWDKSAVVAPDDISDTHMYKGEVYTMESLWRAALVGSSNKAVLSLVDGLQISRDVFVERMNQKATELGMTNTRFVEPTGLDPLNVSTAADVALLLEAALDSNEIRQTLLLPEYHLVSVDGAIRHHTWNTNWLLLGWITNQFYDLRGGKTGYIPAAGYNFAMQVADGRGDTVDVVVLGADSHEERFTDARDIAMSVFDNYVWPENAIVAGEKIEQ